MHKSRSETLKRRKNNIWTSWLNWWNFVFSYKLFSSLQYKNSVNFKSIIFCASKNVNINMYVRQSKRWKWLLWRRRLIQYIAIFVCLPFFLVTKIQFWRFLSGETEAEVSILFGIKSIFVCRQNTTIESHVPFLSTLFTFTFLSCFFSSEFLANESVRYR